MIQSLFVLLFGIASVITLFVVVAGTDGQVGGIRVDSLTGVVLSAFALILWGFVAINSFSVTTHSGGSEFSHNYPGVAFLAVAGGAIATLVLFKASIEEFDIQ